jgi:hypothetical protein
MEIEIIRSPIDVAGFALAIAGGIVIFKHYRDKNTFLILFGAVLVFLSHMAINYCLGQHLLSLEPENSICSPLFPYIRGLGFICIGAGLILHVNNIKKCNEV